jgi:hypothetical protein
MAWHHKTSILRKEMGELTGREGGGAGLGNAPLGVLDGWGGGGGSENNGYTKLRMRRSTLLRGREQRSLASCMETIDMRGGAGVDWMVGSVDECT